MLGYRFSAYVPPKENKKGFEPLLKLFLQLLIATSGNVSEALHWLTNLDKRYQLTSAEYGIGDFIEELKRKGFIEENPERLGTWKITAKTELTI
ncbi:MAG: hypothetical protein NZ521_03410, partial [Flammeovirgaceae bacterium]|nr:hypothetical protein [Flammeovirgaceae bacterium]MDW8287204.1 hypothetical protein [Flammeovirgaceae bacterium]